MIISCNLLCNLTRYLKNTLLRFTHIFNELTHIIQFTAVGSINFVKTQEQKIDLNLTQPNLHATT